MNKSTKLINELFDYYLSNYLTSYGSPYLTLFCRVVSQIPLQRLVADLLLAVSLTSPQQVGTGKLRGNVCKGFWALHRLSSFLRIVFREQYTKMFMYVYVCRELLSQHRIRVHINFFLSLAFNCLANVAWYGAVHYDLLVNPIDTMTVIHRNPVRQTLISNVL